MVEHHVPDSRRASVHKFVLADPRGDRRFLAESASAVPHEIFSAIWHAGPLQRNLSLYGDSGPVSLTNYWRQAMRSVEWAQKHPATQNLDLGALSKIFPMVFFVDGVEVYTNNEFVVWCWSMQTTAGSGDAWDTRFPLLILDHAKMHDAEVQKKVFADVANYTDWEVRVLESKRFPPKWYMHQDFDKASARYQRRGQLLADGFGAVFTGIKGDRKSRKEVHGFARNYHCTFKCERCFAMSPTTKLSVPSLWFTRFDRNAGWRKHQVTHDLYERVDRVLSPYLGVRGFRLEMAYGDMTHDLYIGAGLHHVSNHCVLLAELGLVRDDAGASVTNVDLALAWLTIKMRRWCKANGIKYPPGKFTRAGMNRKYKTTYPELSTSWKAAVSYTHLTLPTKRIV